MTAKFSTKKIKTLGRVFCSLGSSHAFFICPLYCVFKFFASFFRLIIRGFKMIYCAENLRDFIFAGHEQTINNCDKFVCFFIPLFLGQIKIHPFPCTLYLSLPFETSVFTSGIIHSGFCPQRFLQKGMKINLEGRIGSEKKWLWFHRRLNCFARDSTNSGRKDSATHCPDPNTRKKKNREEN